MPRAEKTKTGEKNETNGAKPGVIKLSNLAIEGREFELGDKVYKTKSPIELTLPEIAKVDKMGKQVNVWLPSFNGGSLEDVDMEKFERLLVEMVVAISNVPEEVANKTIWWQQLIIIGLFQSVAGMDFLEKQLMQLGGLPPGAQAKIQETLKGAQKTPTPTSPTP